jgi:ferredoxin
MRVRVDLERCVAAGSCVATAPDTFDQRDEDGLVLLLHDEPPPELEEAARRAASVCPAFAISIEE